MTRILTTAGAALLAAVMASPAHAVLVDHGVTYTLTEANTADPLTDQFTLTISGINGAADTEGGRSGINAIAFNKASGFTSATLTSPGGWTTVVGGLNSSGCNGSGNFFCFDNPAIPPTPGSPLATNSTQTFVFTETTATGDFTGYNPAFKIDWVGSKNNYDLVSKTIGLNGGTPGQQCATPPCVTDVPEPSSLSMLAAPGAALFVGSLIYRRRRAI